MARAKVTTAVGEKQKYLDLKAAYQNALALTETDTKKVVVLNFKALQLLRIKTLQQELFSLQMRFTLGGIPPGEYPSNLEVLDNALCNYGKALQKYEQLSQNNLNLIPEGATLFRAPEELIAKHLGIAPQSFKDYILRRPRHQNVQYEVKDWTQFTQLTDRVAGGNYILNNPLKYRELDKDGREARAQKYAFSERFSVALFGGVALLGPVIIMTLRPGQIISLVTVSISILIFALTLAFLEAILLGRISWLRRLRMQLFL